MSIKKQGEWSNILTVITGHLYHKIWLNIISQIIALYDKWLLTSEEKKTITCNSRIDLCQSEPL